MVHRIFAALLLLSGLALLFYGIRGVVRAERMAEFLAFVAPLQGIVVDQHDWARHWRLASVGMVISAVGFLTASAGVFRRRPWGSFVVAATCALMLLSDLTGVVSGYSRYAFEIGDLPERTFLVVVLTAALIVALKQRHAAASSNSTLHRTPTAPREP